MQVAWLERDHFLLHRRIVFSALPPVRREEGLSQACFARALFCLEGSASDLITSTGPTSSYHHVRGWNFSIWMTPEGPVHAQYRNRGTHTCPFPGRAPCMCNAVAKWGPTALWGIFYMSVIFICLIYFENIFSHLSLTITQFVSFFLYGNCASFCCSNKSWNFIYLGRLKLHRAIVQSRNRSKNLTHWKWRMN